MQSPWTHNSTSPNSADGETVDWYYIGETIAGRGECRDMFTMLRLLRVLGSEDSLVTPPTGLARARQTMCIINYAGNFSIHIISTRLVF